MSDSMEKSGLHFSKEFEPQLPILAILGAQGKFGGALKDRLLAGSEKKFNTLATVDKLHNREVVENSDLIVVSVQPNNTEQLLREITPVLKKDAQIVSFAGFYPLSSIHEITGRPAARGMADPWWKISAAVATPDFSKENFERFFGGLTVHPTLSVETDKQVDEFTATMSYMFVTLLMKKLKTIKEPDRRLEAISPLLGIKPEEAEDLCPPGNPEEMLKLMQTKGGITEHIVAQIQANPDITPDELLESAFEKIYSMASSLSK